MVEGRVTKKLSQEISETESRILGVLSNFDEILLNLQLRIQSGTVPGTARNMNLENHELTEDGCLKDTRPEVDVSVYQPTQPMNR